jgi:hypothetical protein
MPEYKQMRRKKEKERETEEDGKFRCRQPRLGNQRDEDSFDI